MLTLLRNTTIAFLLAGAPLLAAPTAQTPTIQFGRTTITLTSSFASFVQGTGAVLTDLNGNTITSAFTLPVVTGAMDLSDAAGEVEHSGGIVVNASGQTARIENLILDTSNPAAPMITAAIIYNDHFQGRIALFAATPPSTLSVPLIPTQGVLQVTGLQLTLAAPAAATLSTLFGYPLPAGTLIGSADLYAVLAPSN